VWLPGRAVVFHRAGTRAVAPQRTSSDHDVSVVVQVSHGGVA
jgi:hypothetical protein